MAKIIQFPGADPEDNEDRDEPPYPEGEAPMSDRRYPELMLLDMGLSDDEVDMLLSGDPASRSMIFEVAPELTEADLERIPILSLADMLLREIHEAKSLKATSKGYLPTGVVKSVCAKKLPGTDMTASAAQREGDSTILSWARQLCQSGGLLKFRDGRFTLTKAGTAAVETSDYSEIYRLMFECHLRKPELLDRFDRYEDGGTVGRSLPFLLFAARDTNYEFLYEEDFATLVLAVFDEQVVDAEKLKDAVKLKFFKRFGEAFGLFAPGPEFERPVDTGKSFYDWFSRFRKTPVFDRVFRWHADPPARGVMRPEQAAIRWMDAAHQFPIDSGSPPDSYTIWYVESFCLRAIERCPEDPDAYVVWARLYESQPETALAIVKLGLKRSAGRAPDTPEGMSAWSDYEFRDVMRLHFLRAQILLQLGRPNEAFKEYEWLLDVDPHDGMGARDSYVTALIEHGHYRKADKLLTLDSVEDDPFRMWNLVLTAFALGDKHTARERLAQAIDLNPYVPECLLDRMRAPEPDEYMPGDMNEAIIYENLAFKAWKSVRGAREWLKRNTPQN